jgi:hypothetical protein
MNKSINRLFAIRAEAAKAFRIAKLQLYSINKKILNLLRMYLKNF